jgi:hypothetical protein
MLTNMAAAAAADTTQALDPLSVMGIIAGIGIFLTLILLIYLILWNNARIKEESLRKDFKNYFKIKSPGQILAPEPQRSLPKFPFVSPDKKDGDEGKKQEEYQNDEIAVL